MNTYNTFMWTSVNTAECVYINTMSVQMQAYTLIILANSYSLIYIILYYGLIITIFPGLHKKITNPVTSKNFTFKIKDFL